MAEASSAPEKSAEAKLPFGKALIGDIFSGLGASLAVAPFILAVDKAVIQNTAGSDTLLSSLGKSFGELLLRPQNLLRRPELYFIWGVYSSTYMIANVIDTVGEQIERDSAFAKFVGASAVNMGAGMAKDRALAQMFGTVAPKPMALSSFGFFAIRDTVTIAASFTLPEKVSNALQQEPGSSGAASSFMGGALSMNMDSTAANISSQIFLPMAVQFISTPAHLAGLDIYNNPARGSGARAAFVGSQYFQSTLARMGRICPAFGIGGLGNKYLRNNYRAALKDAQAASACQ